MPLRLAAAAGALIGGAAQAALSSAENQLLDRAFKVMVRFYERSYFDHPAFGVIALVTPAQGARAPGR